MSHGNSFNVLAFLLGLAIGLWISVVVLFLVDFDDDPCCAAAAGGTSVNNFLHDSTVWVPGGDGDYFCTNDDEGSMIIIDEGSAVIADEGSMIIIDASGNVQVDEGSAVIADKAGILPAPGSDEDQLGRDRGYHEFMCASNDEGGAVIADAAGRIAVVTMPNDYPSERCGKVNGNAVVFDEDGNPINIDEGGAVIADEGSAVIADESADPADDGELGDGNPQSDNEFAYCMVALEDSDPVVIRPAP